MDSSDSITLTKNGKYFSYNKDLFNFCTNHNEKSLFDKLLQSAWAKCVADDCFRYTLDDVETRILPGKYGFVAQLNIKRAIERRKPQLITDISMPFDHELFHFGKVSSKEIIFYLCPLHWKRKTDLKDEDDYRHAVIINVSPLEYCHSLLVPDIKKRSPQVLTFDGLRLALETMLISCDPTLRIGFNSLGAFASVNHFHFHLYYLKYSLALETVNVRKLAGECYEITKFPAEGFVFQLLNNEVESVVRSVMKLVDYLVKKSIAHNVLITRGKPFTEERKQCDLLKKEFDAVRIYVWARESYFGTKENAGFNPALCELGGHFPIKDKRYFKTVSEDEVATILHSVCHNIFNIIKKDVENLYEKQ